MFQFMRRFRAHPRMASNGVDSGREAMRLPGQVEGRVVRRRLRCVEALLLPEAASPLWDRRQ